MATRGSWPVHEFPYLTNANHKITSRRTKRYNCIAWAGDDLERPWWPQVPGWYWPPGIPELDDIPSFIQAFQILGYTSCNDGVLEPGFEKIALFADPHGTATHATRQLKNGKWTSKMGPFEDIEHDSCQDVRGPVYGTVTCYMRRARKPLTALQIIFRFSRCVRVLCRETYWDVRAIVKGTPRKNVFS